MRVREIVAKDRKELLSLLKATGVFKEYEITVADEVIQESFDPTSGYKSYCCVNEHDRPVGYVCWGETPCTDGTFDLYWIAVHPECQGNGVGQTLLQYAESEAKKEGARLMIIETSSTQNYSNTRYFYTKSGYAQLAVIPNFYQQGDDKIIYGKNLLS